MMDIPQSSQVLERIFDIISFLLCLHTAFFLTIAQTTKVPCNVRLYNKGLTNKIFGVDPFVFVLYVVPEM